MDNVSVSKSTNFFTNQFVVKNVVLWDLPVVVHLVDLVHGFGIIYFMLTSG